MPPLVSNNPIRYCFPKGESFNSPYEAFLFGSQYYPHTFPQFSLYDHAFVGRNMSAEPSETFEELCNARAVQLRNKYSKLALCFSGGTDSVTVYRAFVRNNIPLDYVIVTYTSDTLAHPSSAVDWVIRNHPDPHTKIIHWDRSRDTISQCTTSDDSWLTTATVGMMRYNSSIDDFFALSAALGPSAAVDDIGFVYGMEKPHLLLKDRKWYSVFLDRVYSFLGSIQNLEMFFVSEDLPDLHTKQCHLLMQHIKRNYPQRTSGLYTQPIDPTFNGYYQWAAASGREFDVVPGCSFAQKLETRKPLFYTAADVLSNNISINYYTRAAKQQLQDKTQSAINYFNGFKALQTSPQLLDYMLRMKLLTSADQAVTNYNGITSTPVFLGND